MNTIIINNITYLLSEERRAALVLSCQAQDEHISIPQQVEKDGIHYTVKGIGKYAFKNCPLKTISLPETILLIDDYAFIYCRQLESIRIPEGIKEIAQYCFSNCVNLSRVELPETIRIIHQSAFATCWNLKHITFPQRLCEIGKMAFFCCYQLQDVTLPRYMVQVDDCAFAFCKKLNTITIPGLVERVGNSTFLGCEQLQAIILKHTDTDTLQALHCYYLTKTPLRELKDKFRTIRSTKNPIK